MSARRHYAAAALSSTSDSKISRLQPPSKSCLQQYYEQYTDFEVDSTKEGLFLERQ